MKNKSNFNIKNIKHEKTSVSFSKKSVTKLSTNNIRNILSIQDKKVSLVKRPNRKEVELMRARDQLPAVSAASSTTAEYVVYYIARYVLPIVLFLFAAVMYMIQLINFIHFEKQNFQISVLYRELVKSKYVRISDEDIMVDLSDMTTNQLVFVNSEVLSVENPPVDNEFDVQVAESIMLERCVYKYYISGPGWVMETIKLSGLVLENKVQLATLKLFDSLSKQDHAHSSLSSSENSIVKGYEGVFLADYSIRNLTFSRYVNIYQDLDGINIPSFYLHHIEDDSIYFRDKSAPFLAINAQDPLNHDIKIKYKVLFKPGKLSCVGIIKNNILHPIKTSDNVYSLIIEELLEKNNYENIRITDESKVDPCNYPHLDISVKKGSLFKEIEWKSSLMNNAVESLGNHFYLRHWHFNFKDLKHKHDYMMFDSYLTKADLLVATQKVYERYYGYENYIVSYSLLNFWLMFGMALAYSVLPIPTLNMGGIRVLYLVFLSNSILVMMDRIIIWKNFSIKFFLLTLSFILTDIMFMVWKWTQITADV